MKFILAGCLLVSLFCGCSYSRSKDGSAGTRGAHEEFGESARAVDFALVEKGLFRPRCLGCHSSSRTEGGVNLETYSATRAQLNRIVYRVLEKKDMPPSGSLSEREMKLLNLWVEEGAPERANPTAGKVDPGLATGPDDWAKVMDKIFRPKCFDCHSGAQPEAGLDLSSYEGARQKATAIFDRIFLKQDMPKAPYPAVTPRERRVLMKWFEQGLPR